jgi:hypothetical protein
MHCQGTFSQLSVFPHACSEVRVCDPQEAVMLALHFAQKIRTLEPMIGESFLTFAGKVASLKIDKFSDVASLKLHFSTGSYNATMHKVVVALSTVMTEKAAEVVRTIDHMYGKEIMSNNYNKLWRLLSAAQKLAGEEKRSDTYSLAEAIQWLVESFLVALRMNRVSTKLIRIEDWCKHPKTCAPGLLQVWSCRAQAWTVRIQLHA